MDIAGILLTAGSAVLFGIQPLFAVEAAAGGSNSVTAAFFRAVLALPVIAGLAIARGERPGLTPRGLAGLVFICGGLSGVTTLLLYLSYEGVQTGIATTLHFIYPSAVCAGLLLFRGERPTISAAIAIAACTAGVALFAAGTGSGGTASGMALAVASGVTFAAHLIIVSLEPYRRVGSLCLAASVLVALGTVSGLYGAATGTLSFSMTPRAWACLVALAMISGAAANLMLQAGIKRIGPTAAAVLSTFEPLTSVAVGAAFMGEGMSAAKVAGTALILGGVIVISRRR